mmetsp:Transcript_95161/g.255485  ORF Transcript_95161/g.255485 Transcript_95161/m.255485 type:complete len:216 (+) Transcript_95161:86-733(+)
MARRASSLSERSRVAKFTERETRKGPRRWPAVLGGSEPIILASGPSRHVPEASPERRAPPRACLRRSTAAASQRSSRLGCRAPLRGGVSRAARGGRRRWRCRRSRTGPAPGTAAGKPRRPSGQWTGRAQRAPRSPRRCPRYRSGPARPGSGSRCCPTAPPSPAGWASSPPPSARWRHSCSCPAHRSLPWVARLRCPAGGPPGSSAARAPAAPASC